MFDYTGLNTYTLSIASFLFQILEFNKLLSQNYYQIYPRA